MAISCFEFFKPAGRRKNRGRINNTSNKSPTKKERRQREKKRNERAFTVPSDIVWRDVTWPFPRSLKALVAI